MITEQQLEVALGSKRNWATEELLTTLNTLEVDGADLVRENWLTHANILKEGTYSMEQYMRAVQYVSLKQMGHTNQQAYSIVCADRYQEFTAKGYDERRISSHIAAFHKGALVQKLLSQSVIPLWLLYQDQAHMAVKTLVQLMTDPEVSFKVRSDSADKLLNHIKRPEAAKVELDITHKQADGTAELTAMMRRLAEGQLRALDDGGDVVKIANLPVLEGECLPVPGEDNERR